MCPIYSILLIQGGGIAGGRKEYEPKTPTKRCTLDSAPSRLPIGALLISPDPDPPQHRESPEPQGNHPPSPASPYEEYIFMDNTPPPNHNNQAQGQVMEQAQEFTFPANRGDMCLQSRVSVMDSPHSNGPEFVPHGPEQEGLMARLHLDASHVLDVILFHWRSAYSMIPEMLSTALLISLVLALILQPVQPFIYLHVGTYKIWYHIM
ncbi:uncharacterized protein BT62DRAFT_1013648 [Guyanagaster necrorhizus]|uniref:Uncharacterized protein n=1 Tax=Guyanagaster necrorhizus TaxID=856835 RepID=A0A9P7VEX6_9AGAR|nr:uncharacterized protein BT62DRAFT_1013648 [Guyanagaster necrorhizus MCA 3950]KAG7439681.1 hypothetical protein BT62DRAFT_1013648 [Guyanagaster necrorhizus MCA 3950]